MKKERSKIMRLNKIVIIAFLSVGFFMLSAYAVQACSVGPRSIVIQAKLDQSLISQAPSCLDETCQYMLYKSEYGDYYSIGPVNAESDADWRARVYPDTNKIRMDSWETEQLISSIGNLTFLNALDAITIPKINFSASQWSSSVSNWFSDDRGTFLSGDLTIQPYNPKLVTKYESEAKTDLMKCNYQKVTVAGDWMFMSATSREYCQTIGGVGGMCLSVGISYPQFIGYLFTNISSITIPYIIGFIVLFALLLFIIIYIIYKREWKLFLKPSKTLILLLVITFILLVFVSYFNDWKGLLLELLIIFLILSLVQYGMRKLRKRKGKNISAVKENKQ